MIPNKVQQLIKEYIDKWDDREKPDPIDDMMNGGTGYYNMNECNPSLLIHCLWDDSNVLDEHVDWELNNMANPCHTLGSAPEFVEDTIIFLKALREIPEEERLNQWLEIDYPDPLRRREIFFMCYLGKAHNSRKCNHGADDEPCDESCETDSYHAGMRFVCPVCKKQICIKKLARKDMGLY